MTLHCTGLVLRQVDDFEVIRLSSSSEKEETTSSAMGIRCKMCGKLVKRRNLASPSRVFQSERSKQKRLVGSGKATTIRYCCCKGRRRNRVQSKQVQSHRQVTAPTADQKIELFVATKQGSEEPCSSAQAEDGSAAVDEAGQSLGKAEVSSSAVSPSASNRSSISQENCTDSPLTAVEKHRGTDVLTSETETKKDVVAGNEFDLECAGEDGFMSDPVCMGEDTEGDTNAEQSISPESAQEAMSTESETEDSTETVMKQEQLLVGESRSEGMHSHGDKIPADNETVSKDGCILSWTKYGMAVLGDSFLFIT